MNMDGWMEGGKNAQAEIGALVRQLLKYLKLATVR